MKIALVFLVCVYGYAEAQLNYAKQYIPQQIKYDDERPTYGGIPYNPSVSKEPLLNSYENSREAISQQYLKTEGSPYPQPEHYPETGSHRPAPSSYRHTGEPEKASPYQLRNPPHDYPQATYYRQPESHNSYDSRDHTAELKEHQLSHVVDHHRPSHMSVIYPQSTEPKNPQPVVPQLSPYQLRNPSHDYPQATYYRQPESHTNYNSPDHTVEPKKHKLSHVVDHHRPSHMSVIYPQSTEPKSPQPVVPQLSHTSLIYPQPEGTEHSAPKDADNEPALEHTSDYRKPADSHSQPPNSRVVRDPRLPLYFTMYEKRIIQDPMDKYGKGPWRYLTYGHGITYGSKEPGKVFEKGYGYIRALGRDHCKNPENNCPRSNSDKPFEYEGRKEPYFGYRPH